MGTSNEFLKIIQGSVVKEMTGVFYQLSGPFSDFDPMLHEISNWFDLPPFEKALDYYVSYFPEESEVRKEPMTLTYCYKWILKGFISEVNLNMLTIVDRIEYLKGLSYFFEDLLPVKEIYLTEIDKLNNMPKAVLMGYSTQIDFYIRAAKGAVEVITEAREQINALTKRYSTFINQDLESVNGPKKDISINDEELQGNYWENAANNFNHRMLITHVRLFFSLLTTDNKERRPFLTQDDVDKFIKRAFIKEYNIDKLTLDVPKGEIGKVISLFHLYYSYCTGSHYMNVGTVEKDSHQSKYINLIADHFTNYTLKEIKPHFRSSDRWINPLLKV